MRSTKLYISVNAVRSFLNVSFFFDNHGISNLAVSQTIFLPLSCQEKVYEVQKRFNENNLFHLQW